MAQPRINKSYLIHLSGAADSERGEPVERHRIGHRRHIPHVTRNFHFRRENDNSRDMALKSQADGSLQ